MIDRTWDLMQKHLESGCYDIVSSQDSAPTEAELCAAGAALGCAFPEEFIAHSINKFGGLLIEVKEELWPQPKAGDAGPSWSFLNGLYTLGIAKGIPDFMNLELATQEFQAESGLKAVPCLGLLCNADVYCFDPEGVIVRWDHELNELEKVDKTFFEVLDYELGELEARKDRKVAGG